MGALLRGLVGLAAIVVPSFFWGSASKEAETKTNAIPASWLIAGGLLVLGLLIYRKK